MIVAGTATTFDQPTTEETVVVIGLLVVAALAVLVAGGFAIAMWRRKWLMADLPTSDAAHVFVGMNEVVGRAQPVDQPIVAPYSASECVWYRSILEKEEKNSNNNSSWKTVSDEKSEVPFYVEDDTGKVLIRPKGASVDPRHRNRDVHTGKPQRYGRLSLLGSLGGSMPLSTSLSTSRYRTTEWYLRPGDEIYVLGEATLRGDVVALEFAPVDPRSGAHKRSLLIAAGDERRAANRTAIIAVLLFLVTLLAAVALPATFHNVRTVLDDGPDPGDPSTLDAARGAMVVAGGGVLAVLAVLYVVRLYNRLVSVKTRAQAAWSLIDVHLRRRHDLLPALAEVVGAAATHERTVQETVARLRTAARIPDKATLPSESQVRATEAVDATDHADAQTLLALSEAYPDLQTSENFQRLAEEIRVTEDGIAFARGFYNDAINVMRDRRQRFPGVLLAPFVQVPSLELWSEASGR